MEKEMERENIYNNDGILIFEGEYLNGKKKEKNMIIMVD